MNRIGTGFRIPNPESRIHPKRIIFTGIESWALETAEEVIEALYE
jgi:hypothetical protein